MQTERIKTINVQRAWAWDWTGDHRMMAEVSTDILVDILFIEYSDTLIVVWKFVMFCNSENYTISLPISLICFWKLASLQYARS